MVLMVLMVLMILMVEKAYRKRIKAKIINKKTNLRNYTTKIRFNIDIKSIRGVTEHGS